MLKLLVKDVDICRISTILAKSNLKATITGSTIIIDSDDIKDEVIESLFKNFTIISVQNYQSSTITSTEEETEDQENSDKTTIGTECSAESQIQKTALIEETMETLSSETIDSEYYADSSMELVTLKDVETEQTGQMTSKISDDEMVYRGEVYKWGKIKDSEDGKKKIKECVIIIQNDYKMSVSEDTIALFCTSNFSERAPIRFSFAFIEENMVDHSKKRLQQFDGRTMFVGHIKGVSRKKLGKYLGTMNSSFMNTLQPAIDFCLGLKRSRTVNWAQLKILSMINMDELFAFSEEKVSNSAKVTKFLKLFNFDMSKNGMKYVKKAILISSKMGDYRLEDLAEIIAKEEHVEAEEVLRMIIVRINENFGFKKSPTISFIRLIYRLLRKG